MRGRHDTAGYLYPTFIEHISLALAVSTRYTHHNQNKKRNHCLATYCKAWCKMMYWKVWMNLWEPCMVPEGRMHIAQLTESEIVRSLVNLIWKRSELQDNIIIKIYSSQSVALALKVAQGKTNIESVCSILLERVLEVSSVTSKGKQRPLGDGGPWPFYGNTSKVTSRETQSCTLSGAG